MAEHELRIWPSYFEEVLQGRKTFEVRRADRDFVVDDVLVLQEWNPGEFSNEDGDLVSAEYTGRVLRVKVTYLMKLGEFFTKAPFVVMAIRELTNAD